MYLTIEHFVNGRDEVFNCTHKMILLAIFKSDMVADTPKGGLLASVYNLFLLPKRPIEK